MAGNKDPKAAVTAQVIGKALARHEQHAKETLALIASECEAFGLTRGESVEFLCGIYQDGFYTQSERTLLLQSIIAHGYHE